MKPSQLPWKWLLLSLLVVLLTAISLIPRLIGDTSDFGARVAERLSAWSGGEVRFTGPVKVSIFPDVSVRGPLEMTASAALPFKSMVVKEAKASLDLLSLLGGNVSIDVLRLQKPRIELRDGTEPGQAPKAIAAKVFTAAPVRVLSVRNGRIDGAIHPIKDVYLQLDAGRESGALSGSGAFAFHGETVHYTIESGIPRTAQSGEQVPVALTLVSAPVNAKVAGTASFADRFRLEGEMQTEIGNLRKFLTWIGFRLADGESLKALTAGGLFHYVDGTLTFDDGIFILDGNKAKGAIAVAGSPHPRIEGTLAFDRLVLDPYLRRSGSGGEQEAGPAATTKALFDPSLLRHFDADLRISGAEIVASPLKLGKGGFTISSKNGSVTSEIGELELCGGIAEGRINIDLAKPTTEVTLIADLADIAIEPCLEPLKLTAKLSGTGSLKTELTSKGDTLDEITRNLSGTLKLDARDGSVPVDFAKLLANKVTLDANGWIGDGTSSFDELKAECRLSAGQIWCETLDMRTPRERVAGAGDINLPHKTLNWNLSVAKPGVQARGAVAPAGAAPELSIRGPLSQPMIKRTDRSTVEDGTLPTGGLGQRTLPQ